eukprot:757094-Hanusia_phi.AAC.3
MATPEASTSTNTVVPFDAAAPAPPVKPNVFRVDFTDYMCSQALVAEIEKKQLIDPKTHTRSSVFVNGVVKDKKLQEEAGAKGLGVHRTASFPHDYPDERIKRVTGTQSTVYQVHEHFASPHFVAIDKLIKDNKETILHMFPTIAYIGFPSNNQTMTGPGMLILTDRRVYMYCHEDRTAASGNENMFGTTCWPRVFCCLVPGGMACCPCFSPSIGRRAQNCKESSTTRQGILGAGLADFSTFAPAAAVCNAAVAVFIRATLGCAGVVSVPVTTACDASSFKYNYGFHDFKRVEPYVVREFTKGDDSEWSFEELQELEEALMILEAPIEHTWRDGTKTKGDTPEAWKHMVRERLPGRSVKQCQFKREEMKKGYRTYQHCRVAAYRAINFKYLDRAKNKALTTSALVDNSICQVDDLCKFTIAANSLENLAKDVKMVKPDPAVIV